MKLADLPLGFKEAHRVAGGDYILELFTEANRERYSAIMDDIPDTSAFKKNDETDGGNGCEKKERQPGGNIGKLEKI